MYLGVQDLVLDDNLFSHLKFLLSEKVLKDIPKLEDGFINKVLFDLIMLIHKTITDIIFFKEIEIFVGQSQRWRNLQD